MKRDPSPAKAFITVLLLLLAALASFPTKGPRLARFQTVQHLAWLPLCTNAHATPDKRFGIAEHSLEEMALLGFPNDGRFHARQWRSQEEDSPVIFLRTAHRSRNASRWCLGAYRFDGKPDLCARPLFIADVDIGWLDGEALCAWMKAHPGKAYIVGNETNDPDPVGDGLTPAQYARWYRDAYALVRQCDPTARIGSYGPAGYHTREFLASVWIEFMALSGGTPMRVDFFPIHHYPRPGFRLNEEVQKLERWIGWLNAQNGKHWRWESGREYWLTEFGLPSWEVPCPTEEGLRLMDELIPWLMDNDLGIALWAWWPSGNKKLFPENTLLIEDDVPTDLGRRYFELATTK